MADQPSKSDSIFWAALRIDSPEQRASFLSEACPGDQDLRAQLEELLAAYPKVERFLEQPAAGASPTIDQPPLEKPGTQIGPYKLLQQLGEGGMGVVYMAEQKEPVKRRAFKGGDMVNRKFYLRGIIKSLGLVFGDIGTSPIYTLTVVFLFLKPTQQHVMGVLSLIVWTLIKIVTLEYAWLGMSLGKRGEGGTIVLKELLSSLLRSRRKVAFVTFLSFIGISLLVGDGVITPAISILSAVEGSLLIPGFEHTSQNTLIIIAGIIAILLFSIQKKGTEKVAGAFGPLMVMWFSSLAISGIISILYYPSVLKALNPYYAFRFLLENGIAGFFVLSGVFLCATGGEALYADMGHLGRNPIVNAWYFVFVVLVLNYLGQGAFLIKHPAPLRPARPHAGSSRSSGI